MWMQRRPLTQPSAYQPHLNAVPLFEQLQNPQFVGDLGMVNIHSLVISCVYVNTYVYIVDFLGVVLENQF